MHWPFGRRTKPGAGPVTMAGAPPGEARPHDAWRSLPAVQRTIGGPPVVAPAAPFAERLATRQPPDLALQPLGHEVSPLAAAGLVVGIATPGEGLNGGRVELPVQPMQRLTPEGSAGSGASAGGSSFDESDARPPDAPAGAGTTPGEPRPESTASPAPSPVNVGRPGHALTSFTTSAPTALARTPAGTLDLRPAPAATPVKTAPSPGARSTGPEPAHVVQALPEPEAPARRPTLGQARRLGLGAPLLPGSPALQRLATTEPAAAAHGEPTPGRTTATGVSGQPAAGPRVDPGGDRPSTPPADPTAAAVPTGSAPEGRLEVVQPLSIQRHSTRLPGDPTVGLGPGEDLPSASIGGAPPIGSRTVAGLAVQATAGADPESWAPPTPLPVESGLTGRTSALAAEPAIGPTLAVRPTVIRASSAGPLLAQRAPAHEGHSRGAGGDGPVSAQAVVSRSIAGPVPASLGRLGPGLAAADDPSRTLGRDPAGASGRGGSSATMARLGELFERPGPAGAGPVQRAVVIPELSVPSQAEAPGEGGRPAVGASPGPAGEPAPGARPTSAADRDRELDELARRLYGRIRSKLAAELLADRERAGVLVDLR